MLGVEVFSFEAYTFAAAELGTVNLNASNILAQIDITNFTALPLGLAFAATIRVGNLLGAGDPVAAHRSALICTGVCLAAMFVSASLVLIFPEKLGLIFSNDKQVVARTAQVSPFLAVMMVFDGIQATVGGVLRGMGKQSFLAGGGFVAFFVLGLPLGLVLCFGFGLGLEGLWCSLCCGALSMMLSFGWKAFLGVDWQAEAVLAMQDAAQPLADAAKEGDGGGAATADEKAVSCHDTVVLSHVSGRRGSG
eukprot:NODE_19972_length_820_cov_3.829726.p2 GENE.NODE_19972_length_820_cov_3.829726~~NODE_19972_length_820_cov_3.829726.p2  ORF type:complete len:267 (-),score=77.12 NODE_19972_length_820_cov_3.829726:18-767(-)